MLPSSPGFKMQHSGKTYSFINLSFKYRVLFVSIEYLTIHTSYSEFYITGITFSLENLMKKSYTKRRFTGSY